MVHNSFFTVVVIIRAVCGEIANVAVAGACVGVMSKAVIYLGFIENQ
jgi:hypothetical protein